LSLRKIFISDSACECIERNKALLVHYLISLRRPSFHQSFSGGAVGWVAAVWRGKASQSTHSVFIVGFSRPTLFDVSF
jgi:hypothetical protein